MAEHLARFRVRAAENYQAALIFPTEVCSQGFVCRDDETSGQRWCFGCEEKKKIWLKVNDLLSCTAAGLEKKSLRNRRREILIKTSPACTQWMHFNLNYTFLPLFSPKKIKLNQVIYILFIQTIQMQAINRAVLDEPQSCVWWRNHLNNRNYFKSFWTKQTKTLISFCHRVSRLPSWQFWGNWGSDSYSVTCDYGKLTNWYKTFPKRSQTAQKSNGKWSKVPNLATPALTPQFEWQAFIVLRSQADGGRQTGNHFRRRDHDCKTLTVVTRDIVVIQS